MKTGNSSRRRWGVDAIVLAYYLVNCAWVITRSGHSLLMKVREGDDGRQALYPAKDVPRLAADELVNSGVVEPTMFLKAQQLSTEPVVLTGTASYTNEAACG
jgi:hypothetical protein